MTLSDERRRYTIEEYLELDRHSQEKHEYHDGFIINLGEALAIAGGSANHSLICANVVRSLGNRLGGGSCRVYDSSLRVRIPRKTLWAYPDATIICGPAQVEKHASAGETALNPQVIIEVLSPSTEGYDRGDKFARYRELDSLYEYILISQHEPRIETFRRDEGIVWAFAPFAGMEAVALLRSVNILLPLAEAYEGVDFSDSAMP